MPLDVPQQVLGRHGDPFHRVGAVLSGCQRLCRARPAAVHCLPQQGDQVGKVPVRGGLGDQGGSRDGGHGDRAAARDELTGRSDDSGPGALLLIHPPCGGSHFHPPTLPGEASFGQVYSRYES